MRRSLEQFQRRATSGGADQHLVRPAARVVLWRRSPTPAVHSERSAVSELTDRLGRVHLPRPRGATWAILAQSSGPRARVV